MERRTFLGVFTAGAAMPVGLPLTSTNTRIDEIVYGDFDHDPSIEYPDVESYMIQMREDAEFWTAHQRINERVMNELSKIKHAAFMRGSHRT